MAKMSKADFDDQPTFEDMKDLFDIDFDDPTLPDDWMHQDRPAHLAELINVKFPDSDLERLANVAVQATLEEVEGEDVDTQVVAELAVRRALGLEELPGEEDV